MARIEMTTQLAMAAGHDAANRRMRSEGRTTWNEEDWDHACEVYERCMEADRVCSKNYSKRK